MSKALEARIKAIMEGKNPTEELPTKPARGLKAKETADKNNKQAVKGHPEADGEQIAGKGKPDKPSVIEGYTPDDEKCLTVPGKETSAGEDNAKIQAGRQNKLDSDGKTVSKPAKTDSQDDNGDNSRGDLSPAGKAKSSEKSGKLSSPMKESMSALFDGESLSEEFQSKAATIFEAAVAFAIEQREVELQEEYQQRLDEAVEEAKGELVEQIDGYLDYVVEQWLQDNAVALESGMKVELVGSFIQGMKDVFVEHYVDVPEDKVNVVEAQAEQISALEAEVATLKEANEAVEAEKMLLQCEDVLAGHAAGLTAIEEEKFRSLAESVEFDTVEQFADKAKTLRESFFKKSSSQDVTEAKKINEGKSSTVDAVLKSLRSGETKFVVKN